MKVGAEQDRPRLKHISRRAICWPSVLRMRRGAARNHTQLGTHRPLVAYRRPRFWCDGDPRSWRLADLGAKHTLLLAEVGSGNMPEPIVRDNLAAGRLKRVDLPDGPGCSIPWRRFIRPTGHRAPPSPPRERRPLVVRGRDSHPGGRAQRQKLANEPVSGPGARATTVMASEMTASSEASCSPCLPVPVQHAYSAAKTR